MSELDELKRVKMEELQKQLQNQQEEEEQLQQQINQIEAIVKTKLTKDALSRIGNIKAAHPEKYIQLLAVLGQLIAKVNVIDDKLLKDILVKLEPKKHQFNVRRK